MTTYRAKCERSGQWWAVSVPELPGVVTQARRLDQVEEMVREVASLMLDVDPQSFGVELDVELPPGWAESVREVTHRREQVEEAARGAREAAQRAVQLLVEEEGLPVRDAARILGVSYQRIAQIHRGGRAA